MEKQNLDSFNFKGNPFMDLMNGGQNQMMPQYAEEQTEEMLEQPMQGQQQNVQQQTAINQLQSGQNPDRTKLLMGALASLEKFITESDTKEDIILARGIVSAISKLIAKDQERFSQDLQ